jgi:general bacterial porin, GBP family
MKKLVMAAAVLGAFAGTAQAQTSVTLYGIADGDLRFDHTNLGTLKSVGSGGESGSRWGIRGSEDLGGGLKANFIFEQGFQLDDNSVAQGPVGGGASAGFGGSSTAPHNGVNGSSRLFSRIATVGLSGDSWGEIRFGRAYHPAFLVQATADPFGAGFVSEVSNLYTNNTIRNDNAIYYDTPRFAGLQVSLAYQMGESTTDSPATQVKRGNDRYEAGLTYSNGPIYAGVGYETIKANTDAFRIKTFDAAATYDFGFLKLHALYWQTKNDNPSIAPISGADPWAARLSQRVYSGGITVPFGAWTFLGLYSRLNDHSTANVTGVDLGNPHVNAIGAGFRYSLSKRTIVYFGFDRWNMKNGPSGNAFLGFVGIADASNAGLYTAGNLYGSQAAPVGTNAAAINARGVLAAGVPISQNVNPYSYQIGLRHSF